MAGRWRSAIPIWILAASAVFVAVGRADGPAAAADDLSPLPASEWNRARAAHLLERAGFGATPEEVARVAAMTPERAVDWLVDYEKIDNSGLQPFDESNIWDAGMDPFPPSRAEAVRIARERGAALGRRSCRVAPSAGSNRCRRGRDGDRLLLSEPWADGGCGCGAR